MSLISVHDEAFGCNVTSFVFVSSDSVGSIAMLSCYDPTLPGGISNYIL